jgi:hypothetical protein
LEEKGGSMNLLVSIVCQKNMRNQASAEALPFFLMSKAINDGGDNHEGWEVGKEVEVELEEKGGATDLSECVNLKNFSTDKCQSTPLTFSDTPKITKPILMGPKTSSSLVGE